MRVAIATRIFDPEPSAATFRLTALAAELAEHGHDTTVLTVKPPKKLRGLRTPRSYRVSRFPVLRDATGYVRGYLPYLSFDIPLFFRVLFGTKQDVIVVEPPPTTGVMIRVAAWLRRTPYVYYAADIWSDASTQTGAPAWMTSVVASLERWAWRGAKRLLSVSEGVTRRLEELGMQGTVVTVGNGVNVAPFVGEVDRTVFEQPTFVYAGTASEWHGAAVFVEAFAEVQQKVPNAKLVFIGGGSERAALRSRAAELQLTTEFYDAMSPEKLAPWLQRATASLASVRPGAGYDFAFPTKLYSSAAAGAPMIFAGVGPAVQFIEQQVEAAPLGIVCPLEPVQVASAMIYLAETPWDNKRRDDVSKWAEKEVSLEGVARNIRKVLEA